MNLTCLRGAAAWMTCCVLVLAGPWPQAHAAPVVFQRTTGNGALDETGRFTAQLVQGSGGHQALLQLFTAGGPGSRISGLFVQDATGALAVDAISGEPLVRLSQTLVYEVLLASAGSNKIAVIKALSTALGIGLTEAKDLVDRAPTVIRTASTPAGNEQLQQKLQEAGATVRLTSRADPSAPDGANAGVTTPGGTPTGYDVVLATAGANKVALVKLVRDETGLGLVEAKKLVDEAPSVIRANAGRAAALALQQALQASGATVELKPVGAGSVAAGPIVLPTGGGGIAPDLAVRFAYDDPLATPALQLALDLDVGVPDLWAAWAAGQFVLGLEVTNAAGLSDLYLAAQAVPPAEVPEPSTAMLLPLALLALLSRKVGRRRHARAQTRGAGG